MKRFHVHLNVQDLPASIAFYSRLFASGPARVESDYAKWMLTDPQGIAWEHFHTLGNVPVYGETRAVASQGTACCAPRSEAVTIHPRLHDIGKVQQAAR